jgi:hypothetical protein
MSPIEVNVAGPTRPSRISPALANGIAASRLPWTMRAGKDVTRLPREVNRPGFLSAVRRGSPGSLI